jgi:hypothetical protein
MLAVDFTAGVIPAAAWTHVAHIRVGTWHVARFGPDEALRRLRAGIRRLNEQHGTGNSPTRGYHETITAAYVRLIAAYLDRCPAAQPLAERARRLIEGPLGARDVLLRFYSRERLLSPAARADWVEPDLAPLVLPAL